MTLADARTLLQLARGMPRGSDHAQRLAAFYGPQANGYDGFRERLLPARRELLERLSPAPGERIVELGAGTGRNPAFIAGRIPLLHELTLVDLCAPLLAKARERWSEAPNVTVVEADACTWQPDEPVDVVYFSYALTMIPDWRAAISNAISMLRPGGRLGVVDFTLFPQQMRLARMFWRAWFGHDGVHLDPDHATTLTQLLPRHALATGRSPVPYLPGPMAPHYIFLGVKD